LAETLTRPEPAADVNNVEADEAVRSLNDFNADWESAIAELQALGIIGTGGSLIFRENRAFFEGVGDWFTTLASGAPRTDIVMAATISFRSTVTAELETCSLLSRIVNDSEGRADRFLEVGLDNDESVYFFDFDETSAPLVQIESLENWDASAAHHYLIIAQDDFLTVYIDGLLVFDRVHVVERSGTYGIALRSRGATSRCEGVNLWAYEAPSFQPGVCEITAGSAVNKRSGPGTSFDQAGQLIPGRTQRAEGQTLAADGFLWWQLDDAAWVRSDIVKAFGDCQTVPEVSG
jgi:hypothetical protein